MPGTIVFKPIEAHLGQQSNPKEKLDSFCFFSLGDQKVQSQICKNGGESPKWNDSVTLTVMDQPTCTVEVKTDSIPSLGSIEVDLHEVETQGSLKKWYTLSSESESLGEILLEATYTPDDSVSKSKMIKIGTKPNAETEHISDAEPHKAKVDPDYIRHEKAGQGNIPESIDPDRIIQERSRWEMEPTNSIAKVAETNEFGDYQPFKQLPLGDVRHEYGSGMMQQGSYYSGQQTSYGEAYPMSHKSVGTDQLHYSNPTAWISDRTNPFDYARYQQQAFLPHENPLLTGETQNTSVIDKAINNARREEQRKQAANMFNHGLQSDLGRAETQFSDQNPSVNPENQPEKKNAYVKDMEDQNSEMMSTNGKSLLEKDQMRPNTASTAISNSNPENEEI